jgi:SAM-dependent methyltransferase
VSRDHPGGERSEREHNETQRRYFEARVKRTMVPRDSPYLNRHVDELLRFGDIRPGERVLEVGCGMGRYTLLLARRGLRVEGLDLSPVLLQRLETVSGGRAPFALHCADVAQAPAHLHGAFDAVVGFFVLHHVHDLGRCLAAARRLVRRGGRLVFLEPNPWNPLYYVQIAVTPGMTWAGDGGLLRMRRAVLPTAMAAAGLAGFEMRRFGFFPPALANRRPGRAVERALERLPLWRPLLPFQLFRAVRDA